MKITHNLLLGAVAALSLGSATASVTYVTGATSFQSVTDNALRTYATNNYGDLAAIDSTSFGKETNEVFTWGTSSGNATNLIIVHWSGSENAIQTISSPTNNPVTLPFYPTNVTLQASYAAALGTPVSTNSLSGYPNNQAAQWALYDNYQNTTYFYGYGAGDGKYYSTIANDTIVAGQGFVFIGNTNWPTSHGTNVTGDNIRSLYANGAFSLANITGNTNDQTSSVFAVGRNIDGGTRTQGFAVTGVGAKAVVNQYQVLGSNNLTLYPIESIDGISSKSLGNSGYGSDGALRAIFTNTLATGAGIDQSGNWAGYAGGSNYLLGYTSIKNGTGSAGVVLLNYNGVAPTTANIENGNYALWGYTHIGISPNYADATASNIASQVITTIKGYTDTQLGTGNANLTNITVSRTSDGGVISQNY
jgi:hypothetical protein